MRPDALIGKVIANYRILGYIGRGAIGAVYRAVDGATGATCALKILPQGMTSDHDLALTRLSREAHALARLKHPNIVRGLGCGRTDEYYYFAMEYVNGESLESLYRRMGQIQEKAALLIAAGVTKALQHAHSQGVVHRDIKPANILITREGQVKVTDFGMAKSDRLTVPGKDRDTPLQVAIGTPRYMSPEQARGETDLDIRADLYSLGITLWTIMAGRFPYDGTTPEILAQHISAPLPPIERFVPNVSTGTIKMLDRMTAKRREDRYQTPTELLIDVMACLMTFRPAYPTPKNAVPAVVTERLQPEGATLEETLDLDSSVELAAYTESPGSNASADDVFYFITGMSRGRAFLLRSGEELILGRDSDMAHVMVHDALVSRQHCKLAKQGGVVTITDLETTNGTYVNGQPTKYRILEPGDTITLGNTKIILKR